WDRAARGRGPILARRSWCCSDADGSCRLLTLAARCPGSPPLGKVHRLADRFDEVGRISKTFAGDVICRAVGDRARREWHGGVEHDLPAEPDCLHRDVALVVIEIDQRIERAAECPWHQDIRRYGPRYGQAGPLPVGLDGRCDEVGLLVPQGALIAGMGVQGRDADTRGRDTELTAQSGYPVQRRHDSLGRYLSRYIGKWHVAHDGRPHETVEPGDG